MSRIVVAGGRVFDARSGTVAPADVLVEAGRVVEVGLGLDGDEMVDVSGRLVLPGLFDCHVHLAGSTLDIGAAVYDPASLGTTTRWRTCVAPSTSASPPCATRGSWTKGCGRRSTAGCAGPRVRSAVNMVSQTGGHSDDWTPSGLRWPVDPGIPDALVDGLDSARRVIRLLVRAGADQIKVATTGGGLSAHTDPRVAQLRELSCRRSSPRPPLPGATSWRTPTRQPVIAAVRAGVRSIEHGTLLTGDGVADGGARDVPGADDERSAWGPWGREAGANLPPGGVERSASS